MTGLLIFGALATATVTVLLCTGPSSVEGTVGKVIVRGTGLNGHYYTGSGVGPLHLFRSSSHNAAKVNQGLKGHPIQQSVALALGDEFPKARDDLIHLNLMRAQRKPGTTRMGMGMGGASPFANIRHWRYDSQNGKNEYSHPYRRPANVRTVAASASYSSRPRITIDTPTRVPAVPVHHVKTA